MNTDQQLEQRIEKNALAIQELSIKIETLDREIDDFLGELNVSAEQLTTFVGDEKNFTDANWNHIVKHKQALDAKLKRELENIRNPAQVKKALAERNVPHHWIMVR